MAARDARVQRGAAVAVITQRLDAAQSVGVRIRRLAEAAASYRSAATSWRRSAARHARSIGAATATAHPSSQRAAAASAAAASPASPASPSSPSSSASTSVTAPAAAAASPCAAAAHAARPPRGGRGEAGSARGRARRPTAGALGGRRRLLVRRLLSALGEQREREREAEAQRVRALAPQRAAERILVARLAVEFVEQHVVELTDRCLPLSHARAVDGGARRRRRTRPQRAVAHARVRAIAAPPPPPPPPPPRSRSAALRAS